MFSDSLIKSLNSSDQDVAQGTSGWFHLNFDFLGKHKVVHLSNKLKPE